MADKIELCAMEAEARALIAEARDTDWSPCQQRILNFFKGYWHGAYTAEQITGATEAIHGPAGQKLQPFLTKLVRRKVLRSRVSRGKRLYELALS